MAAETPSDQWARLSDRVHEAVKSYFPLEGRSKKLVLHGLHFDENEAHPTDIRSQVAAKDAKKTWGVPLYADVGLVDKESGKTLDRTKVKLITVPKLTNRYSFIVDGNERQVDHMWRLRAGVYANQHANGKYSAEFNLAKQGDKGGFVNESRLYVPFDPKSKQLKLRYGDSLHTSLYSVLKMMGVSDEQMKKEWGTDIYRANAHDKVHDDILKFHEALGRHGVRTEGQGYDAAASTLIKEFDKTRLLPESTKAVFGKPIEKVNGEALLLASKRILQVSRNEIPPDDRNSLVFKKLHGVDDFLYEKITHPKTARSLKAKVINGLDKPNTSKVREVVSGDLFTRPVKEFFDKSMLSRNPEQANPLEMMSNHRMTTIVGEEGGIKNERAIRPEMKVINPSHFGFLDPLHTPESEKTGISLHLPLGVKKDGNEAKARVWDLKENKFVWATPAQLHAEHVVMPDQVKIENGKPHPISARVKMKDPATHEILEKPFKEGRYLIPSSHMLFDEVSNLIPFLQNNQGNRASMAAKQFPQAIALSNPELPLVQVQAAGTKQTWEKVLGIPWSHTSEVDGKVIDLKKAPHNDYHDAIVIQDRAGKKHEIQVYNHFPLNDAKTMIHSSPLVRVGDEVKKGQVLADSNFTRNGHLSLGTNLKVAYLPYKGYNFEDGIVISESAAKKLTSEHLHRHTIEIDPAKDLVDKKKFTARASTTMRKLTEEQSHKIGDDGIIRVGSKVNSGDVLIAAVGKPDLTGEAARAVGRLGSKALTDWRDKSIRWESDHPGEVVKISKDPTGKRVTVYVKSHEPAEIGDKVVGRHANKGIITQILPDHEMPRVGGPDGDPVHILLNPSGVVSRINLGQMLETASAKIAAKTGQPYIVNNFGGAHLDYTEQVKKDLAKHGLSDTEAMYDPVTKQRLTDTRGGDPLVGLQYIMKQKHQVEKKLTVRSRGMSPGDYSVDMAPKGTGAPHPGQAISQYEMYALLAHGAKANLRDMATYKAEYQSDDTRNPWLHTDFWDRVQQGQPLPKPRPTFAYRKFEAYLTAMGLNLHKEGHTIQLQPLTDRQVVGSKDRPGLSHGEIHDPGRLLRGKDAKELEKGLFDPKITGGLPNDVGKGRFWSHITLAEPLPNPMFVGTKQHPGPAVILSGMKFDDFEDVVKGKKQLDGKTGGQAIYDTLKKIDVKKELEKTVSELPTLNGTALDKANRKAKFLKALDHLGMDPHEAYMRKALPVLPPLFRPIVAMPDGSLRTDDPNFYYHRIGLVNNQLKNPVKGLPDSENQKLREQLYDLSKSLLSESFGGKPVYESSRKMKGILDIVKGEEPKTGYFQHNLIRRRQELSMRSTIIPEPAMHLDHVGIPKDAAMELYKPFVIRELKARGYSPPDALREIKSGSDPAWRALQSAMDQRPIMLKRDPALHKFSIQSFKPKLVEGKAIKIHPLVCAGYNADFDGDTMSAYVPLSDDAVRESRKMFPSNNLFSSTHFGVMFAPDQESIIGLHMLTKWGKDAKKSFSTYQDALKAYEEHKTIGPTDVISVGGRKTTLGRLMFAERLPDSIKKDPTFVKQLQDPNFYLMKKGADADHKMAVEDLLDRVARVDPHAFPHTVDHLKNLGNEFSYRLGYSFSLKDLDVPKKERDEILARADAEAAKVKALKLSPEERDQRVIEVYDKATKELGKLKPYFANKGNNAFTMVDTKARGKWDQFRQMTLAPMLMQDGTGKTLTTPVRKSYAEGLDVGDYWTAMHGARKGTLQRVEGTSEPGALAKQIINVVMPTLVTSHDCGTSQGIAMDVGEDDIHDRYLAAPAKAGGKELAKPGDLITPDLIATLKKNKIDRVVVRSPLKCQHGQGVCSKCYGLNENGKLHEVGTNIGVISGQSMGEPATQMAMDSFHSGGVATGRGGASVSKFERLRQLLNITKTLPNSAVLASSTGRIEKIERDPGTNGHHIVVNGEKHFVPAQRALHYEGKKDQPLHVGMEVRKGDALTDGPKNPHELLPLTDIHTVQNYLTDELYNTIYKNEGVRRRNIETVIRGLTNLTKVRDAGSSDHLPGDLALRTVVEEHNRSLKPGEKPILHTPLVKGTEQMALSSEDWLARLNFQQLQHTLLEGASKGWVTNIHGTNPIPAYAYGAEFGKGTLENPEHY